MIFITRRDNIIKILILVGFVPKDSYFVGLAISKLAYLLLFYALLPYNN